MRQRNRIAALLTAWVLLVNYNDRAREDYEPLLEALTGLE